MLFFYKSQKQISLCSPKVYSVKKENLAEKKVQKKLGNEKN